MRVSDDELKRAINRRSKKTACPCEFCETDKALAKDLRDARALLREADQLTKIAAIDGQGYCLECGAKTFTEPHVEDCLVLKEDAVFERIRQYMEASDE